MGLLDAGRKVQGTIRKEGDASGGGTKRMSRRALLWDKERLYYLLFIRALNTCRTNYKLHGSVNSVIDCPTGWDCMC